VDLSAAAASRAEDRAVVTFFYRNLWPRLLPKATKLQQTRRKHDGKRFPADSAPVRRIVRDAGGRLRDSGFIMPLMTTSVESPSVNWAKTAPAILWGGLLAGALDITAAFVTAGLHGIRPARVLQFIASGLLGPTAFQGGAGTAALGVVLHFFIAFSAAAVFYLAGRKVPWLTQRAAVSGALYGVAVYVVMYWVVMPLSAVRRGPFTWDAAIIAVITHIVCVGLPIALTAQRYTK
jgi:uncharacterized membrane protein YagU involved in acid resistance